MNNSDLQDSIQPGCLLSIREPKALGFLTSIFGAPVSLYLA